jgi:hypothetical protein
MRLTGNPDLCTSLIHQQPISLQTKRRRRRRPQLLTRSQLSRDNGLCPLLHPRHHHCLLWRRRRVEEQVMEEREGDERVDGVGDELLLGEHELVILKLVILQEVGDHGGEMRWQRGAQEDETMAQAEVREGCGERKRGQDGNKNSFVHGCELC